VFLIKLRNFSFQIVNSKSDKLPDYLTRNSFVLGIDWWCDLEGLSKIGGTNRFKGSDFWWRAVRVWRLGLILMFEKNPNKAWTIREVPEIIL
jgi:hypothetical protein